MTDQTPDPWEGVKRYSVGAVEHHNVDSWYASTEVEEHSEGNWLKASEVNRALTAERAQHQQEIEKRAGDFEAVLAAVDAERNDWRDEVAQRDETIRQLQDAFARCQEVQQATAETWRIEHDQMAEQIRLLRGAMAADDERLRRAAEQAGILYVSCDTAEALAEQIARLSAEVEEQRSFEILMIKDATRLEAARDEAVSEAATLRAERDAAQQQIATLTQERDEALKVLAPNMPESGLVDACRQVKQVAVSEAGNSTDWMNRADAAEARCATLTAALEPFAAAWPSMRDAGATTALLRDYEAAHRAISGVPTP